MKTQFFKTLTVVLLFLLASTTVFAQNTTRLLIKVDTEKEILEKYYSIRGILLDIYPGQIDIISSFPHNQTGETSCAFFEIWMVHPDRVQEIIQAFSGIAVVILEHQSPGTLKKEEYADYSPSDCDDFWYLNNINFGNCYQNNATATIAIIDNGIDIDHDSLENNIWVNQKEVQPFFNVSPVTIADIISRCGTLRNALHDLSNEIDEDNNGYYNDIFGWNFVDNDNNVFPEHDTEEHGTHMAGINHSIAKNALLMPLKCFSEETACGGNVLGAIVYAQSKNVHVADCSFGYKIQNDDVYVDTLMLFTQILYETMQCASSVVFVCSAGNEVTNNDVDYHFPSNFTASNPFNPYGSGLKNVISVGGSTENNQYWGNSGANTLDLRAPATNICSTIPNNGYAMRAGTSCSAAIVSGAVACMYSHDPSIPPYYFKSLLRKNSYGILSMCPLACMREIYTNSQTIRNNTDFEIEVKTTASSDIGKYSCQFQFEYDENMLEYIEYTPGTLPTENSYLVVSATPGIINVAYAGTQAFSIGESSIIKLTFRAINTGSTTPVITNVLFNEDPACNVVIGVITSE